MSARGWKPGDVAMARFPLWGAGGGVTFASLPAVRIDGGWARMDDTDDSVHDESAHRAHPLRQIALIDHEDREAVARLDEIYQATLDAAPKYHSLVDVMQAALREFANPGPVEPQTTGAIVTDGDGETWVRHANGDWACLQSPAGGSDHRKWAGLVADYGPIKTGDES